MLLYFSVDMRLYFPLIVWAVPVAASAIAEVWRQASRAGKALLALFVAATMLGFPASRGDTDLGDLTRTSSLHMPAPGWESVEAYSRRFGATLSLILTDMDPPFVHALTAGDRIVAPIQDDHDYSHNPAAFRFGAAEREALVQRAIDEGRSVILLLARRPLAKAEGFEGRVWQVDFENSAGGGLAVLTEWGSPCEWRGGGGGGWVGGGGGGGGGGGQEGRSRERLPETPLSPLFSDLGT